MGKFVCLGVFLTLKRTWDSVRITPRLTCVFGGSPLLTAASPLTDITGAIILQTYRAVADYEKNSKTEMSMKMGDVVDVIEKSESGKPRKFTFLSRCG